MNWTISTIRTVSLIETDFCHYKMLKRDPHVVGPLLSLKHKEFIKISSITEYLIKEYKLDNTKESFNVHAFFQCNFHIVQLTVLL